MSGLRVVGFGTALPDRVVTNADLAETLETSDEWIVERTGIRQRYVGGTTSALAIAAGSKALERAGLGGADIDLLILATTTGDKIVPGTSPTVQDALGITGGAFDLNAACSGFVYGLVMANSLLSSGTMRRILLVGAETLSKITDWDDRTTAVLFGDGAGALVLEATEGAGDLLSSNLGSDGSLTPILYCDHNDTITMDGKEVFRRAVRVMVDSASKAIEDAGLTSADIDVVVPHQANLRIISAACQRLDIEEDRAAVVIDRYGNTSSASIPLAIGDSVDAGLIETGDILLLTGFGAGMTWASAVLRWSL
jgi:3-oxoacyl-[acyl-carrier-protein] synthase-3